MNEASTSKTTAHDTIIPFSHLPQQKQIPFEKITKHETINDKCNFQGKIFVLGLSKTGTSTMKIVLNNILDYKCSKEPMASCRYYGLEHYYERNGLLPLLVAPDDISWIFHSKSLYTDFIETLLNSQCFMDAPWPFLYPLYDQLIPKNHSKFILLMRDSTRDVVNSNMKMFVRRWKKIRGFSDNQMLQYDYKNFSLLTENKHKLGVFVSWKEFWLLLARQYELHNQNVIKYFSQIGRLDDLLIINLGRESRKVDYSEQWYKITHFLGCQNISNEPLPKKK